MTSMRLGKSPVSLFTDTEMSEGEVEEEEEEEEGPE
jgi:hypothetical protein